MNHRSSCCIYAAGLYFVDDTVLNNIFIVCVATNPVLMLAIEDIVSERLPLMRHTDFCCEKYEL